MSTTLKVLGIVGMAALIILALATGTALWTLQTWPNPMTPTIFLGVALLILFAITGVAWFGVTQRELASGMGADGASAEERGFQRLIAIVGSVLLGVGALGISATWNLDTVRASMVDSRETHVQLEALLKDQSPLVKLAVCEEMFHRGWTFRSQQALVAALDPEPGVALKCFQTAQQNEWKGVEALAGELLRGWDAALLNSQDPESACQLAPWTPAISDLAGQRAEVQLLTCSVAAQNDAVRQCCGQTLAQRGKLPDILGDAEAMPVEAMEPSFISLVKHAFQPLSLTAPRQKVAQTIGSDNEALRRWILDFGCAGVDPTAAQPKLIGGLIQLVEADSCNLGDEGEAEYRAGAAWLRLCDNMSDLDPKMPTQQRVCEGVRRDAVTKSIETAQLRVWEAIRAPFLKDSAGFIERGLNEAAAFEILSHEEVLEQEEYLNSSAVDTLGLTSFGSGTCRKLNPATGQVTNSLGCNRVRRDMTVREYLEEKKGMSKSEFARVLADPFQHKDVQKALEEQGAQKDRALKEARKKTGFKKKK